MNKAEKIWNDVMDDLPDQQITLSKMYSQLLLSGDWLFLLAKYMFVCRMMEGRGLESLLDVGCSQGLGTYHMSKHVNRAVGVDFDESAIDEAVKAFPDISFYQANFLRCAFHLGKFDVVTALDVIEHIEKKDEERFLLFIYSNLKDSGFCVVATPNETASPYASQLGKETHVNLFSAQRLQELFATRFYNVFLFGMNDQIAHTGYKPMCHHQVLVACNKKEWYGAERERNSESG